MINTWTMHLYHSLRTALPVEWSDSVKLNWEVNSHVPFSFHLSLLFSDHHESVLLLVDKTLTSLHIKVDVDVCHRDSDIDVDLLLRQLQVTSCSLTASGIGQDCRHVEARRSSVILDNLEPSSCFSISHTLSLKWNIHTASTSPQTFCTGWLIDIFFRVTFINFSPRLSSIHHISVPGVYHPTCGGDL